jgi:ketosteroid isomerase-like protein
MTADEDGERWVSARKAVAEAYVDGFRRTDHEAILACLTDDVEWVLHGYRTLRGKAAFDGEIENDATVGSPTLHLDRLIEEGDTVVAVGSGEMILRDTGRVAFHFTELYTFTGDRISRVETFHINEGGSGDTILTAPPG